MKASILIVILAFFFLPQEISAQQKDKKSNYFPVWSYHDNNTNIFGLSVGLVTGRNHLRNTNSHGIRLEIIGYGLGSPLLPQSPVAKDLKRFTEISKEPLSENIYGINLSLTGSFCDCKVNGLSVGGVGQYNFQINGISASPYVNMAQIHNGVQISLYNDSYQMKGFQIGARNFSIKSKGVQIGLYNYSKVLKGFQIGVWNRNQNRGLPIINWAF